jgi:ATP-dependent protease ClpP protease subunit
MSDPLFASTPPPPETQPRTPSPLNEHGLILLTGVLDEAASRGACERIIELNLTARVSFLQLLINSPGGDCHAGLALVDLMECQPAHTPVAVEG